MAVVGDHRQACGTVGVDMKASVQVSVDYAAQLEVVLEGETDIETALLEHFGGHNVTFRNEDERLVATLSIGKDSD